MQRVRVGDKPMMHVLQRVCSRSFSSTRQDRHKGNKLRSNIPMAPLTSSIDSNGRPARNLSSMHCGYTTTSCVGQMGIAPGPVDAQRHEIHGCGKAKATRIDLHTSTCAFPHGRIKARMFAFLSRPRRRTCRAPFQMPLNLRWSIPRRPLVCLVVPLRGFPLSCSVPSDSISLSIGNQGPDGSGGGSG